jgi:hypothetical protein
MEFQFQEKIIVIPDYFGRLLQNLKKAYVPKDCLTYEAFPETCEIIRRD